MKKTRWTGKRMATTDALPTKTRKPKSRPLLPRNLGLSNGRSQGFDYFRNLAARMGYGTPSLAEGTEYEMVRLSYNYWLMLTLYRNHWLSRRIVDLPAEDMTKNWCRLSSQIPPDDIQRFNRVVRKSYTPQRIQQALKWSRLYGGAGCLICIKGHEGQLDEPLDIDDVNPGAYLGLIPFDRWVGIQPVGDVSTTFDRPDDFGLPEYYNVMSAQGGASFKVHSSRVLRFLGPEVPKPEFQAQQYWGISVLEVVYEELKKRDNASWAMLQLMFRAQILAQKNPELAQMLSGVGISEQALQMFYARMSAQNYVMSNQSMLILGEDGELQSTQYAFSGLGEVYQQFQMDVSGAAEIPMTRLFGRTMTGLGQSNDADERYYEERINHDQDSRLRPQIDKLYPVVAMSTWGEVPDDMDVKFPSIRVLTEEEKAEMADKGSAPVIAGYNAGIFGRKTALKEFRELSETTGVFTNVTDKMIDEAEDEPLLAGEGGEFGGESPDRELAKLSGGAEASDKAPKGE
jgi:phage-related protein (TIGR01555 family)